MQFTFRRDSEGRETIHVGDVAIARVTDHPEGFEWLNSMPGITAEHVREAAVKADEAGFWERSTLPALDGLLALRGAYLHKDVVVDVPVAETTSTIMSLTTEDEQ